MGEFSKRVGEIGEKIVTDFLNLIGWTNLQQNFDIPSINPEKHTKASHGIDAYFHYKSPLITNTLENIIISSKYSTKKYSNSPVAKFKEYYIDLASAIESFKKSGIRNTTLNEHNKIESTFDRGLLFWINNDADDDCDLIQKLSRLELPKDYYHDGIIIIDNKRIEFLFDSITFVKNKFRHSDVQFTYFNTGLNSDDESSKNGNILPVQYLTSNIIPFRVQDKSNLITFILCTKENFDEAELLKLMGLAKNIGTNLQVKTIILFPDYNELEHGQLVNNKKQIFDDSTFTNNLTVESFKINIRR